VGLGLRSFEVSISHSDTPHSIWLLWTSDGLDADTSSWLHATIKKRQKIHVSDGIRTRSLSKQSVTHRRLRPRGHRDRPSLIWPSQ
jgi:hypothetical protein